MSIQFTQVTWYSKLAAVIVLICVIMFAGYVFFQFKKIQEFRALLTSTSKLVSSNGDVGLSVVESVRYKDLTLTFDKMVADNRCPVDVQCIEAGAVTARVTMRANKKVEERNFPSDEVPYRFQDYAISILRAAPPARSTVRIDPKNYIVIFHIEQVSGN